MMDKNKQRCITFPTGKVAKNDPEDVEKVQRLITGHDKMTRIAMVLGLALRGLDPYEKAPDPELAISMVPYEYTKGVLTRFDVEEALKWFNENFPDR